MKYLSRTIGASAIAGLMTICVLLLFGAISLASILNSGYYSDDLVHSNLRGDIEMLNESLPNHMRAIILQWFTSSGRIFPIAITATFPIYYYFPELTAYKLALLLLVAVNLGLFVILVRQLTNDIYLALLGAALAIVHFQFRLYHDPILSFGGFMQSFVALIFLSMILFQKYLETGAARFRNISAAIFLMALYMYEVSLPLAIVFPLMAGYALRRAATSKAALKKANVHLTITVLAGVANLAARMFFRSSGNQYAGTAFGWDPSLISGTFGKQLLAAFPLSYSSLDPASLFRGAFHIPMGSDIAVAAVLFAALYWQCVRRMSGFPSSLMLKIGLCLLFVPAAMIAMSTKYQRELQPGLGYVPVYIQYFGLVMILLWSISLAKQKLFGGYRTASFVGAGVILVLISAINIQNNRTVVDAANTYLHYRRAAVVTALKEGLLSSVPEESIILVKDNYVYNPYPGVRSHLPGWAEGGYPWKSSGLLKLYSGKRFTVVSSATELIAASNLRKDDPRDIPGQYLLEIESYPKEHRKREGYVNLLKVDSVSVTSAAQVEMRTTTMATSQRSPSESGSGQMLPVQPPK